MQQSRDHIKLDDIYFEVESSFDKFSMSPFIINNQYEPWIVKYAKVILKDLQKPIIFDIGANVGLITLPISQINKESQVYSFEALPPCAKVLENNIKRNNIQNVQVINKAVSSTSGNLSVTLPGDNFGGGGSVSIQSTNDHISNNTFSVEAITIDDFVKTNNIKKIDLMKIDVEGWEEHALVGAEESIKKFKPCCIIEFNAERRRDETSENSPYSLWNKLQNLFDKIYLINRLDESLFEVNSYAELRSLMFTGHNVEDLICFNSSNISDRIQKYVKPSNYTCYGAASCVKKDDGIISFLSHYGDGWTNGESAAIISGLKRNLHLKFECFWYPQERGDINKVMIFTQSGMKEWSVTDEVKTFDLDLESGSVVYIWCSKTRKASTVWNNQDPRVIGFNMKMLHMGNN